MVTIEQIANLAKGKIVAPIVSGARALGFRQTIATANVDTAVAIPSGAVGVVVTFLVSGSVAEGRVAFASSATAITVTGTDTAMGYQPPVPSQYTIPAGMTHLHVAGLVASTIATGSWLFSS